jgi:hypothetical protein
MIPGAVCSFARTGTRLRRHGLTEGQKRTSRHVSHASVRAAERLGGKLQGRVEIKERSLLRFGFEKPAEAAAARWWWCGGRGDEEG